jgi:hypothetical protein
VIINPNAPGGYTIFCDDIRHEITGKTTLVGVYNSQLIVTDSLPVTLPQICAAITLRLLPPEERVKPIIKIFRSDQEEPIFVCEADIEPVEPQLLPLRPPHLELDSVTFMQMGITAHMQNLVISEPCALKVRAFIGDDEVRLGSLQISVHPSVTTDQDSTDQIEA